MARLAAIMRTTAARLSALYLLLFTICAVILVFYMTSLSVRMVTAQTRGTIEEEAIALSGFYERGGLPSLIGVIERRSRQPGANLYLIADAQGRILTGNVDALAPGILDNEGWTELPFRYARFGDEEARVDGKETKDDHFALALVIRLPNQMIVLVGRDLGEPERFRLVVRKALGFALGIMALGGFLIWYFVGRRALRRIDDVSAASQAIMGGDLAQRLPVTGSGDEFDRLSENLNAMLARIGMLNEGLKQVSDNIAHDLKTPLTRLRNRAEAALSGKKSAAEYREALEGAVAESDGLIRTFSAILMISRLEAGYSAETTGNVDLAAIVNDVLELYEPAAEDLGVTLKAATLEPIVLDANRELVGQALSNIVDNAIKYSAGHRPDAAVTLSLAVDGGAIRLSVTDNGPGIPLVDRERATERFVRLEKSRSQPGSGLGLSLAKAVMRVHGGSLELDGPADGGLAVSMLFPLTRRAKT